MVVAVITVEAVGVVVRVRIKVRVYNRKSTGSSKRSSIAKFHCRPVQSFIDAKPDTESGLDVPWTSNPSFSGELQNMTLSGQQVWDWEDLIFSASLRLSQERLD